MNAGRRPGPESPPEPDRLLAVARLTRPHGLRGEIRSESLIPDILDFESFVEGRDFWLRREGRLLGRSRITGLRPHQATYLITFEGYPDREAAEGLKGAEACLPREELPELPQGWYWEDDLIGLTVVDARHGEIGCVAGLETIAGRWSVRVERPDGGKVTIPWVEGLVVGVDLAGRRVEVDLPGGYPGFSE